MPLDNDECLDDLPNVGKYKRPHPRTYPTYKHRIKTEVNLFLFPEKTRIVKCKVIIQSRTINNNYFRLIIREKEEMMIKHIIDQKQKKVICRRCGSKRKQKQKKSDLSTVCFKKKTETSEGHNGTLVGSR